MYRRISVPVDGVDDSEQAVDWAVALAQKSRGPIELVNVAFPARYGDELYAKAVKADEDALVREGERHLHAIASRIEASGVAVKTTVLKGTVPNELANYLSSSDTDLVIMTTHDRGRLDRLLIGSVTENVMRHVHIPMLLLRPPTAAGPRSPEIRHILIPLDGSEFGQQIVAPAVTLAKLMKARITLMNVVVPILAAAAAAGLGEQPVPAAAPVTSLATDDAAVRQQREWLDGLATSLKSEVLTITTNVAIDGNPARVIVDFAAANAVDVIAMTTHGRGALKRLIAGSVSEKVLHSSSTTMLMYRPAGPHNEQRGS